jgi:hypothetical protein
VYFALALWLFTGQGYALVLREMVENIPRRAGERRRAANAGSLAVARQRLGQAPLRLLFDKVAGACGTAATPGTFWRGMRLLSMDGTLLDVPDSDANAAAYARSSNGSRPAPYPQVRLLALAECGTLSLLGAVFDSFAVGERTLARRLLPLLKPGVLLMADRGFPADIHMTPEEGMGAHVDLQGGTPGGVMLPIHWGTSNLAPHPWEEPAEGTVAAARTVGARIVVPRLGQPFEPASGLPLHPWWRTVAVPPARGWPAVTDEPTAAPADA